MTETKKSNKTHSYFGKREKKQVQRLARRSLKIVNSGAGLSPTNDFRTLFQDAFKLKNMLTKDSSYQAINPQHLNIIDDIFLDVALELDTYGSSFEDLFEIISEAQNIINHAKVIVNIRCRLDTRNSAISAKLLVNEVSNLSNWILFDLLAYCWNFGKPRCLSSLAALLGSALQNDGSDNEIVKHFGDDTVTTMFDIVCRLTSEQRKPISVKSKFPLIAYRGGYADSPSEVANGMKWFLDIQAAAYDAYLKPETDKRLYLVETLVLDDEVIVQLNENKELWIKAAPHRQFVTIELKPERLPSVKKEGADA